jgi:hypothetical protein
MAYENAREFLSRGVHWPAPEEGKVNIHWTTVREGSPKAFWNGRASGTVDEAIRNLTWAMRSPENKDFYVCMSSQSQYEQRTSKAGNTYLNAIRSSSNAMKFKSIFLDVDVKPNAYPDTVTAVTELGKFRRAAGLPRPTFIVASGSGGFHVHWVFKEAIDKAEWEVLSHQLVEATRTHGLLCDSQCTIDAARILRIPDTFNHKYDPPGDVKFLVPPFDDCDVEEVRAALSVFAAPQPSVSSLFPNKGPVAGPNDLAAGIGSGKAPLVNLDDVKPECAFIREALDTGGAAYTNPLWNLTTFIATFAEDGIARAHEMAMGHPGYEHHTTEELYARKEAERERKDLGWPSCQTIASSGCLDCNACPHRMDGKSPLHFAKKHQTIQPTNDLPNGYVRDAADVVYQLIPQEDGSHTRSMVTPFPMTDGWVQRDPWILNFVTVVERGRKEQFSVPFDILSLKQEFSKHLGLRGMVLRDNHQKNLREFLMSWIEKLKEGKNSVVKSTPYGWTVKGGKTEGFSYGGIVVTPQGTRPAANPNPAIERQYTPTGDIDPWIVAAKLATDQKRPGLDAILATSFGAPLVKFTGQEGLLLSCYSPESGIGKSSTLKTAQAVWGDPIKAVQQLNDTQLSVINKIGEIRNLPMFWDELKTEEDTRRFVNLAFQLSSGKEKSRLTRQAQQQEMGTWETMLLVASNDSLIDYIIRTNRTTTAGLARVLEFTVLPPAVKPATTQIDFAVKISKLKDNYGWAGVKYAEFLGQNHERVEKDMLKLAEELAIEIKASTEERFWLAAPTCVLQGAIYANEIGLTEIDVPALRKFMIAAVENMRTERGAQPVDMNKTINVSSVISRFLNEMRARNTLYTNKINVGRGKPAKGSIVVKRDATRLDGIYVQIGMEDHLIRISAHTIREWLFEGGYSPSLFSKSLEREFNMRQLVGILGSGTDYAQGKDNIWEIQASGTTLAAIAASDEDGDDE